jgi:cytoskeleton protein RodZ
VSGAAPPAPKPSPAAAPQPVPTPAASVAATPASSVVPTAASTVSIRALVDCWIQIRAPDQSVVFSRVLKSGEVYNVPSRPGLLLRTGNAGALQFAIDGKPAPSIGTAGTQRRDVALDPVQLAAGTAVHG